MRSGLRGNRPFHFDLVLVLGLLCKFLEGNFYEKIPLDFRPLSVVKKIVKSI